MAIYDLGTLSADQANQSFHLVTETRGPGRGLSGREQIIYRESRYWEGRVDFRQFFGVNRLAARAMAAKLKGRFNSLRITIDNRGTPIKTGTDAELWLEIGIPQAAIDDGFLRFADGTTFTDGYGFALPSTATPTAHADTPAGATAFAVNGAEALALVPGAYFSVNDFLHICEENADGRITFSPPLRRDVAQDDAVNIGAPTIRVRLAEDGGFKLTENYAHHTEPLQLNVVEDFER